MTVGPVRLSLAAAGGVEIVVGDADLSGMVRSIALDAGPIGQPSRLVVELVGQAAEIEGLADVTFSRAGGAVEFLRSVDADELEKEALSRIGYGDSATQAILDVLAEWAQR